MTFRAKIWVLEIRNTHFSRFFATAEGCTSTLHIRNLGADIPLRWRTYLPEPTTCRVKEVPNEGELPSASYHWLMPTTMLMCADLVLGLMLLSFCSAVKKSHRIDALAGLAAASW